MQNLYACQVYPVPLGSDTPLEVPPCPVCGATSARPTFTIEGVAAKLVTCTSCGLGRLHPLPGPDEIATFYPAEYYGNTGEKFEPLVEKMVRIVAARHARFLVRGLPPGARVLDVGCGRGVLLRAFADLGHEGHGFEVSETAAVGADPRVKIRVAPSLREAKYDAGFFDRVVIWHVLEHVPDPRETVAEMHRILKPGGQLIVAVPNFSSTQSRWAGPAWFHLDLPRHLYHFPLAALKQLLETSGFRCLSEHHFSLRQNPFGWVQSFLNRMPSLPRNSLYTLLQLGGQRASAELPKSTRISLRLAYYFGMPIGLALSLVMTVLRRGATVHVVAEKRE